MNKYNGLQCSNEYINFTIKNYVDCYEDLNLEEIECLTSVFNTLKTHKISIGNQLVDNKALYGIKLDNVGEKKYFRNTDELSDQLTFLSSSVNSSDKKDVLFFQSVAHLCDSIQYLSTEEMIDLNDMLHGISNHRQSLGSLIEENGTIFYPYDRSPKRTLK